MTLLTEKRSSSFESYLSFVSAIDKAEGRILLYLKQGRWKTHTIVGTTPGKLIFIVANNGTKMVVRFRYNGGVLESAHISFNNPIEVIWQADSSTNVTSVKFDDIEYDNDGDINSIKLNDHSVPIYAELRRPLRFESAPRELFRGRPFLFVKQVYKTDQSGNPIEIDNTTHEPVFNDIVSEVRCRKGEGYDGFEVSFIEGAVVCFSITDDSKYQNSVSLGKGSKVVFQEIDYLIDQQDLYAKLEFLYLFITEGCIENGDICLQLMNSELKFNLVEITHNMGEISLNYTDGKLIGMIGRGSYVYFQRKGNVGTISVKNDSILYFENGTRIALQGVLMQINAKKNTIKLQVGNGSIFDLLLRDGVLFLGQNSFVTFSPRTPSQDGEEKPSPFNLQIEVSANWTSGQLPDVMGTINDMDLWIDKGKFEFNSNFMLNINEGRLRASRNDLYINSRRFPVITGILRDVRFCVGNGSKLEKPGIYLFDLAAGGTVRARDPHNPFRIREGALYPIGKFELDDMKIKGGSLRLNSESLLEITDGIISASSLELQEKNTTTSQIVGIIDSLQFNISRGSKFGNTNKDIYLEINSGTFEAKDSTRPLHFDTDYPYPLGNFALNINIAGGILSFNTKSKITIEENSKLVATKLSLVQGNTASPPEITGSFDEVVIVPKRGSMIGNDNTIELIIGQGGEIRAKKPYNGLELRTQFPYLTGSFSVSLPIEKGNISINADCILGITQNSRFIADNLTITRLDTGVIKLIGDINELSLYIADKSLLCIPGSLQIICAKDVNITSLINKLKLTKEDVYPVGQYDINLPFREMKFENKSDVKLGPGVAILHLKNISDDNIKGIDCSFNGNLPIILNSINQKLLMEVDINKIEFEMAHGILTKFSSQGQFVVPHNVNGVPQEIIIKFPPKTLRQTTDRYIFPFQVKIQMNKDCISPFHADLNAGIIQINTILQPELSLIIPKGKGEYTEEEIQLDNPELTPRVGEKPHSIDYRTPHAQEVANNIHGEVNPDDNQDPQTDVDAMDWQELLRDSVLGNVVHIYIAPIPGKRYDDDVFLNEVSNHIFTPKIHFLLSFFGAGKCIEVKIPHNDKGISLSDLDRASDGCTYGGLTNFLTYVPTWVFEQLDLMLIIKLQ